MIDLAELRVEIASDWRVDFRAALESEGCSEKTIQAYLGDVQAFGRWFEAQNGEAFRPELITGVDLRLFADAQSAALAPASWNRRRVALKKLCAWLMRTGAVSYDPFQGVGRMSENESAPRWLSENEIHRLLRAIEQRVNGASTEAWKIQAARDQAIVALMLYAGLREFEVCGLDRADVQIGERKGRVIVRLGVAITVVSKLLGHSRLETTARYVQPGWEDFEKAV